MKQRLDLALAEQRLVVSRSQAESLIKLGKVWVNGSVVTKSGYLVGQADKLAVTTDERYVSRAALKLSSVTSALKLNFADKTILDVGSSTGGFTDFALQHGAGKVIAVDVGTDQLHPSLRGNPKIELHEKTDIRNLKIDEKIDMILIDVSFISLRHILPTVALLCGVDTQVVAMAKPQFETGSADKHKGIIKNDKLRRNTLKELENWIQKLFKVVNKIDSGVHGAQGNQERFYLLKRL